MLSKDACALSLWEWVDDSLVTLDALVSSSKAGEHAASKPHNGS